MVSIQIDLNQCEEITRREAMQSIRNGENVICRLVRNNMKPDIREISTIEELSSVIIEEQRKLADKLEFYKEK